MNTYLNTKKLVQKFTKKIRKKLQKKPVPYIVKDDLGIIGVPKRNIWVFNAGLTFGGNPKWLFIYINKYRPDIRAFWLCTEQDTVDYINALGYRAFLYSSEEGIIVASASGVYVTEQCKEAIPEEFHDCVYLNLFHGVGCKAIERSLKSGLLLPRIMKKYVRNNQIFLNNQLFLVTSPLMEEHFKNDIGLTDDMVIRGGYPRCIYQKHFERVETFDHDILQRKGRDGQTEVIVYCPTFRETSDANFFSKALPDIPRLEETLRQNNQLLIFKMHPIMLASCEEYIRIKEKYEDSPYFLFWDNHEDIYEIIHKIDTAIIDYSSIFYDFLAGGVKRFIRYFFDYENTEDIREGALDYKEMTCGRYCTTFDDLICALSHTEPTPEENADQEQIYDLFWKYSEGDSMEKIIDAAMNFQIKKDPLPTLYSFDIFDTLVSRKGLHPDSIFYYVKEKMAVSGLDFDKHLVDSYVDIRRRCEANVREYMDKTKFLRDSEWREIRFEMIINRICALYNLTEEQAAFLRDTELNAEFNDSIPIPEMIAYAESLVEKGADVILISDMYHSREFIQQLLGKHSKILAGVPIYISSEYGVQKSTSLLFQEIYKKMDFYKYGQWLHYGDNNNADNLKPASLGITPVKHTAPTFNVYEGTLVKDLKTYDAYLVAAMIARFRERIKDSTNYFSYAYASPCIVSYTLWVLSDAIRKGIDTLYFIARDGYFPVMIARQAIKKLNLNIKVKYIYGSRKVWRIPSFIHEIDESFFLSFGDLATAPTFKDLLKALLLTEEQFLEFFPALSDIDREGLISKELSSKIVETVKVSDDYKKYLLATAAQQRVIVDKYLSQQINFDEKFAFVDCWGRGYTQTCLTRLLHNLRKEKFDVPFYYVRSIYPSEGYDIRYNCTCKNHSMLFVEALFSTNINYKSLSSYKEDENGIVKPVLEHADCKEELLEAMKIRLINFTNDFLDLDLLDRPDTVRMLFDYSLDYFFFHQSNPVIIENLADLKYSVTVNGIREYAPALTMEDVEMLVEKKVLQVHLTSSLPMSLARSDQEVVNYYKELKKKKTDVPQALAQENAAKKQIIKKFKSKEYIYHFDQDITAHQAAYEEAAQMPVADRVVIINTYEKPKSEFASIISLYKGMGYTVNILPLKGNYTGDKLEKIATAKYIYMSDISGWFSRISFRKETKLIQLFPEPIPLSGLSQAITPELTQERIEHIKRIHRIVYTLIPTTGKGVSKLIRKSLVRKENVSKVNNLGNPLTDVYFDEERKTQILKKLKKILPKKSKELIVYLPKTTKDRRFAYHYLDIADLKRLCGKKYNMLIVSDHEDDVISAYAESMGSFAYNASGIITQREAMAVADVIVGDCTNILVEGVLTGKPIFFTTPYHGQKDTSALFTAEELTIAPIVNDSYSLAEYLSGKTAYNFKKLNAFRKKYLANCDGHSAERIHQFLVESDTPECCN